MGMNQENSPKKPDEMLRECISRFFKRAEELENLPDEQAMGDFTDQLLFQQMIHLIEKCGVDMRKWEELDEAQLGALEIIQEGGDPVRVVEVIHQEVQSQDPPMDSSSGF